MFKGKRKKQNRLDGCFYASLVNFTETSGWLLLQQKVGLDGPLVCGQHVVVMYLIDLSSFECYFSFTCTSFLQSGEICAMCWTISY